MLFKEISDVFKHPGDSRDWQSQQTSRHSTWLLEKEKVLNCISGMWHKVLGILLGKVINIIIPCHEAPWLANLTSHYIQQSFLRKK